MKDTEGVNLLSFTGKTVELISKAKRIPETAFNVLARRSNLQGKKRIVITAHIDSKIGTTGAIDNATGVTVLLLLAELLKEYNKDYSLELVFFNGEDYYGAPGQITYLKQNEGKME
ncbi:MAG: M28 family metallopeptidase [Sphingobacteriia bacterium]|nr:M28 family metallopeptidase [Sphingobacteriia bacterium]